MMKRHETMSAIRALAIEIVAIQRTTNSLPVSIDMIEGQKTDGWNTPFIYRVEGTQFFLSAASMVDGGIKEPPVPESPSRQTPYEKFRQGILIVGGSGPIFPTKERDDSSFGLGFTFLRWPEGSNASFSEGPLTFVGDAVYAAEKRWRE